MSIKKIISCLIGSALCFSSASILAETKILANYDQLLQALDSGSQVRAVVHFDKCKLESGDGRISSLSGGLTFDVFNHYDMPIEGNRTREVISTSKTVFSLGTRYEFGPINNYVRLHVFKDNTAQLFGAFLDPQTYEQKTAVSYTCPVSGDVNHAGVSLYRLDA
jgi:hypothetical protein